MVGRVATFAFQNRMIDSSMKTQAKWATAQLQVSSGLKEDSYGDMGTDARQALSLQNVLETSQTRSDSLDTASSRVSTMYSALDTMIDLLTSVRTALTAATTQTGAEDTLVETAEGALADFADSVNIQYDGRYLFGGAVTDRAPVDLTALTAQTSPTSADTSWYQGNTQLATVALSSDQDLTYGVAASSSGFEKALRAIKLATTTPYDTTAASEAATLLTEALDELTAVQSGLGIASSRIETAQEREITRQDSISAALNTLTATDTATATVQASTYQAQLEASYSALATVNKLSLTNYL